MLFGPGLSSSCQAAADAEVTLAGEPSAVVVSGELLSVNGQTQVPVGLFGVHHTQLSDEEARAWGVESVRLLFHAPDGKPVVPGEHPWVPAGVSQVIECFYDRYQPALVVSDPENWEQRLTSLARRYAENARDSDREHTVEFWNEPYLNWAGRPGANYDRRYYEVEEATEGGPMRLRGQAEPVEHLRWSKQVRTVDSRSGEVTFDAYLAHAYIGHREPEGAEFEFRGKPYRNEQMWWGEDPTQEHYWSGQQNSIYYRQMLVPFARTLKETNPDVQLIAGWDFHIYSHGWDAWDVLYKPTIDDAIDWLDGVTEHHYGGDTRRVAMSYETVWAYAKGTHGKSLRFYNTEAGGMLDPEQPGNPRVRAEGQDPLTAQRASMTYLVRDIVYLLHMSPDKAAARAAHEAHSWSGGGDKYGFQLLRDLRGRLLETTSPSPELWSVASLNPQTQTLCLVLFNDADQPVNVPVSIDAPAGMRLRDGRRLWADADATGEALTLHEQSLTGGAEGYRGTLTLGAREATAYVFEVSGEAPPEPGVVVTQHPSGQVVNRVEPGQTLELTIAIPSEAPTRASQALVRLVVDGDVRGFELNGQAVALPDASSPLREVMIEPAMLKASNTLVFRNPDDAEHGFNVNAASVMTIERSQKSW
ncbi:MAG: hypothetical protein WD534_02505 [Phycisphaeraceae bacterium]